MSKMVSPLLISVISQGPPALYTGKSLALVQHNINHRLNTHTVNKLNSNYILQSAAHNVLTERRYFSVALMVVFQFHFNDTDDLKCVTSSCFYSKSK